MHECALSNSQDADATNSLQFKSVSTFQASEHRHLPKTIHSTLPDCLLLLYSYLTVCSWCTLLGGGSGRPFKDLPQGKLLAGLVLEYLEWAGLDYARKVFAAVGPDRCCLPRHHSHCIPGFSSYTESHDAASIICPALRDGERGGGRVRGSGRAGE